MNDPATEVRFWDQVLTDQELTVICHPTSYPALAAALAERIGRGITLHASRYCPPERIFVLDQHGLEAENAKARILKPRWGL